MRKITFYVQARVDGGRRAGIDVDGETVLGQFEEGGEEFDPALLWYVDIRCAGDLPAEPELVKAWFLSQSAFLSEELRKLATELHVGLDTGVWPLKRDLGNALPGIQVSVVCSTLRRVASRNFGEILEQLAGELPGILNSFGSVAAAV